MKRPFMLLPGSIWLMNSGWVAIGGDAVPFDISSFTITFSWHKAPSKPSHASCSDFVLESCINRFGSIGMYFLPRFQCLTGERYKKAFTNWNTSLFSESFAWASLGKREACVNLFIVQDTTSVIPVHRPVPSPGEVVGLDLALSHKYENIPTLRFNVQHCTYL